MNYFELLRVFIVFIAVFSHSDAQRKSLRTGDGCRLENQQRGVCRLFDKCPAALQDVSKLDKWPKVCAYDDDGNTIVCCDEARRRATATTRPQPTTIATKTTTRRRRPVVAPAAASETGPAVQTTQISKRKCDEYSRWIKRPTLVVDEYADEEDTARTDDRIAGQCNVKVKTFIHNGVEVDRGEFPHMAHIGFTLDENDEPDWSCGASLISERYVLTAAHCLQKKDGTRATHIRLGWGNRRIVFKAEKTIAHPSYLRNSRYNDIALLRLDQDVRFNDFMRPACLESNRVLPYGSAEASGWGATENNTRGSDKLLKTLLPFVDYETCKETYPANPIQLPRGIDDETMVCAGGYMIRNDTCQGDSGGPLQVVLKRPNCMYSILGITSFGIRCGIAPGVYTRVSSFIPWIESVVWPTSSVGRKILRP